MTEEEMFCNGNSPKYSDFPQSFLIPAISVSQNFSFQRKFLLCLTNLDFVAEDASPLFYDFIHLLGDEIELQGHKKFRGGLDVKSNLGMKSLVTAFR